MGEGTWVRHFGLCILDTGLRGRHLRDERLNVSHARLSLREAADVLRTYRRAAGGNEKPR